MSGGLRAERVADSVRRELARLIPGLRDPRIGLTTITDVRLTHDLRNARVFVTVMQSENVPESVAALNRAASYLRRELARTARLKHTPELEFLFDETLDTGMRVESLLRDIERERGDDEEPGEEA